MKAKQIDFSEMSHEEVRKALRRKGRLNTREAALFLGFSHRTLEKWRRPRFGETGPQKGPRVYYFENEPRYDVKDLEAYEDSCLTVPGEVA